MAIMVREHTIQVLVIEDQTFLRLAIVRSLTGDARVEVVGQGGDGTEAERLVSMRRPQAILLDTSLPDRPCAETVRRLLKRLPEVRIVLLTGPELDAAACDAIRAGAVAHLPKDASGRTLGAALVGAMQSPLPTVGSLDALAPLPAPPPAPPPGRSASRLTPREAMVLHMIANEHSNRQIASQLGIREKTVRNHVWHVYLKLGLASRSDASQYATSLGLNSA